MDRLTRERRKWNMSRIKSRDTKPELLVRSILHGLGCRFRLKPIRLPGRPDVVLTRHSTAVFVHGCFWHRHAGCRFAYRPKSNVDFWTEKFRQNVKRDSRNRRELRRLGWRVLVVWECEVARRVALTERLAVALKSHKRTLRSPTKKGKS
jgi:DNA mismatch endonuclease (patch repair protein)